MHTHVCKSILRKLNQYTKKICIQHNIHTYCRWANMLLALTKYSMGKSRSVYCVFTSILLAVCRTFILLRRLTICFIYKHTRYSPYVWQCLCWMLILLLVEVCSRNIRDVEFHILMTVFLFLIFKWNRSTT